MKSYILWVFCFVLIATACAVQDPATETDATTSSNSVRASNSAPPSNKFVDHMHDHAEKLVDLNVALDNGDLERASIPAFWLSIHEPLHKVPRKWRQYIEGMNAAAHDVEFATDLATARAASQRITEQCQGCHAAAEVSIDL